MDPTIQAALVAGVTGMKTDAFLVFAAILVPGLALLITPALVRWGIKKFRGTAKV
jgi:hypothetical protein